MIKYDEYVWLVIDATEYVCYAYYREQDAIEHRDRLNTLARNAASLVGSSTYPACRVQRIVAKGYGGEIQERIKLLNQ